MFHCDIDGHMHYASYVLQYVTPAGPQTRALCRGSVCNLARWLIRTHKGTNITVYPLT